MTEKAYADDAPRPPLLVPSAPIGDDGEIEGYLQIALTDAGAVSLRGSRLLVDWLLEELAEQGWQIELDELRWCG